MLETISLGTIDGIWHLGRERRKNPIAGDNP
jgi:hypothetical protein